MKLIKTKPATVRASHRREMTRLLSSLIDKIALVEATAEEWTGDARIYARMAREFKAMRDRAGRWYHRMKEDR